jgi:hypothetical protein
MLVFHLKLRVNFQDDASRLQDKPRPQRQATRKQYRKSPL